MHSAGKKLAAPVGKNWLPAEFQISKPAVHRLRAEVPCNYILGRLAAALQSVFEIRNSPSAIFPMLSLMFYRLSYSTTNHGITI